MPETHPTTPAIPALPVRIYSLVDPRDETTFYVGKTIQPLYLRRNQHIQEARRKGKNSPRVQRVREILLAGDKPAIALLEEVVESEWIEAEAQWTIRLAMEGHQLLNVMCQVGSGGSRSYSVDWTPEIEARLGKVADSVLAKEAGVTRKAISYRRAVLGIPANPDRPRSVPPVGRKFKAIILPHDVISRLGTMPDYVLAAEAGVNKRTILRARQGRDIPSFAEQTGNHGQFRPGNFPGRWLKRDHKVR